MNEQFDTKLVCDSIYVHPTHKTDQLFECHRLCDTYDYNNGPAEMVMRKLDRKLVLQLAGSEALKAMLDMCVSQRLPLTVAVARKQATPPRGRERIGSLPPVLRAGCTGLPLYYDTEYIPRMEFAYTLILGDVKDLPITDFLYPEG